MDCPNSWPARATHGDQRLRQGVERRSSWAQWGLDLVRLVSRSFPHEQVLALFDPALLHTLCAPYVGDRRLGSRARTHKKTETHGTNGNLALGGGGGEEEEEVVVQRPAPRGICTVVPPSLLLPLQMLLRACLFSVANTHSLSLLHTHE